MGCNPSGLRPSGLYFPIYPDDNPCITSLFSELPPRPEPVPDFKTLLHCDTYSECPQSLAQCNIMLNPTYLGKSGYCVPQSCRTNRECPTVGDECGDGSISGTCKAELCQYDPVLAAADCGNKLFLY